MKTENSVIERRMSATDVLGIYKKSEAEGIRLWLDGGWAVDALLEKETRPHTDLDVALERRNLSDFCKFLEEWGYFEVPRDEEKKWDIVMGDGKGREVDIHAFEFDSDGKILEKDEYPDGSLDGKGTIAGYPVRCVAPFFLVQFHTRHTPREKDVRDVRALCEKFSLEVPESYREEYRGAMNKEQ